MSDKFLSKKKFEDLMSEGDRYVYDDKTVDRNLEIRHQFLSEFTEGVQLEEQNTFIDKLISGDYDSFKDETKFGNLKLASKAVLTEQQIKTLKHKKSLNRASILVNNHEYKDSEEMTNIKNDLRYVMEVIEKYRSQSVTIDNIEEIEIAYGMLVSSCRYYVDNKNPHFSKGKTRKRLVSDMLDSVTYEKLLISNYKEAMVQGAENRTLGEVLGMSKEAATAPVLKTNEEKPVSKGITDVAATLSDTTDYDAFFQKYYFNSNAAADMTQVMSVLKKFIPGEPMVQDVVVLGKKIRLVQKSTNQLFLIVGGRQIATGGSTDMVLGNMQTYILENKDKFARDTATIVLAEYKQKTNDVNQHVRIRTRLSKVLADFSRKGKKDGEGLAETAFLNVKKDKLVEYLERYYADNNSIDAIIEEVKQNNQQKRILSVQEQELNAIRREQQKLLAGEEKEDEIIVEDETWTKEQQAVKNMLSDFIYSNDINVVTKSQEEPADFVRDIMSKHSYAVYSMIKDDKLVESVLDNMSLSGLQLDEPIKQVLKSMVELAKDIVNEAKDQVNEAGDYQNYKTIMNQYMSLEKLNDRFVEIKNGMDLAVENTCNVLQDNVSKMADTIFGYNIEDEKDKKASDIQKYLKSITKNTEAGQGKFIRTVMKNYFKDVDLIDKREMLSALFRFAKKVPQLDLDDKDIVSEIKRYQIKKYDKLFQRFNPNGLNDYSQEELDAIEEYKQEKQKLRVQANLFGSLLRGAGPLMQKTMQGLPQESLPDEIKEALKDMKSNLPDIPEAQVLQKFEELKKSSHGEVTEIEKQRSLGAATVGQAFLCKIYGPKFPRPEGKEVVIKILRPESSNHLEREAKIMLKCAKETDPTMEETYKGQLNTYRNELNLSIEGENIKKSLGVYKYDPNSEERKVESQKQDVDTLSVTDEIPGTDTILVIDKADGETVDSYIRNTNKYVKDSLDPYRITLVDHYRNGRKYKVNQLELKKSNVEELAALREDFTNKVNQAVKRRQHLVNLANVWVNQAIMETGFFHGDLHAGNIMITDDKATFIDFGNVIELKDKKEKNPVKQNAILKLIMVATYSVDKTHENVGSDAANLFFKTFVEYLKGESIDIDAQKQTELKTEFDKILKMGSPEEVGLRISACLFKAQELGIKLPPSLALFSQGQLRLQNTIDELNSAIDNLQDGIKLIDDAGILQYQRSADPLQNMKSAILRSDFNGDIYEKMDHLIGETEGFKKEEFKKDLADPDKQDEVWQQYFLKYESFDEISVENRIGLGLVSVPKTKEESKALFDQYGEFNNDLLQEEMTQRNNYKDALDWLYEKYKDYVGMDQPENHMPEDVKAQFLEDCQKVSKCIPLSGSEDFLDSVGWPGEFNVISVDLTYNLKADLKEKFTNYVENILKPILNNYNRYKELQKEREKEEEERDEAKIQKLQEEIVDYYEKESNRALYEGIVFSHVKQVIYNIVPEPDDINKMETELKDAFEEKTDGLGEKLLGCFNTIKTIKLKKFADYQDDYNQRRKAMFAENDQEKRTALMNEYNAIYDPKKGSFKPDEQDAPAFEEAVKGFLDAYRQITLLWNKDYRAKTYKGNVEVKKADFNDAIGEVVSQNFQFDPDSFWSMLKMAGKLSLKVGADAVSLMKRANA